MADRGFNSIFILIICIHIQLDVVLLQNPATPGSKGLQYYYEENNDLAIQMIFSQGVLRVTIFYESESESTKKFFNSQMSDNLLHLFKSCTQIEFDFSPCSTSMLNEKNELACVNGDKQCKSDLTISCITKVLKGHTGRLGGFLICIFSGKRTSDTCISETKVSQKDINLCISNGDGAKTCNSYHSLFEAVKDNKGQQLDAIANFTPTLCNMLKNNSMECSAVCDIQLH